MADPGLAADLDAIKAVDNSWYLIINPYQSSAIIQAIATWAESNNKLFIADTQDSAVITTAAPGSDVAGTLKTAARVRTAVAYHPLPGEFLAAAWVGKRAPTTPGSETWAFASMSGPTPTQLTSTQQTNVEAKNADYYYTLGGRNIMGRNSKVAEGTFIDTVRGRDWLQVRMQTEIADCITAAQKIPMTDKGIAIIEGRVRAVLQEGVLAGFLAEDPAFTVSVPRAANISATNKANRILPDVRFDAFLAGAIHQVRVTGKISI